MELEEDTIQTNGRTSSLSDSGLISMCRTSALLKIIATIADGRWREVSRYRAAIQAGIESAQPRLSAYIRLMFQAIGSTRRGRNRAHAAGIVGIPSPI